MNQCRMFLLGCPNFYVATDHLPLIPILGDKALDQIQNPRLRALKEKTLWFNFQSIHVPGKKQMAPDVTSRYPGGQVLKGMMLQMGEDGSTDQMAKDGSSGIVGRAIARATLPGASHSAPRWCQEGDEVLEEVGMVGDVTEGGGPGYYLSLIHI